MLPFYTRVLAPSDYGVMDMAAIASVLLMNILSLQINQSLFRYYLDDADAHKKTTFFSTTLAYYALVFAIITVPVLCFRQTVSLFLFGDPSYGLIVILAVLTLFFTSVYGVASSIYRLEFSAGKYALLSLSYTFANILFIIAGVLVLGLGLPGVFMGQLAAAILLVAVLIPKTMRAFEFSAISLSAFKVLARFGLPLVPVALIFLAIQYIDRLMITHLIGLEAMGLYAIAIKIASVLALLFSGFRLAWGPHVFANYRDPKTKETMAAFFYYICLFSLFLIAGLTLFAADIMRVMASAPFYEAYVLFPFLLLATLLFTLSAEFSVGFALANRNEIQAVIYFVTLLMNAALNYALIGLYGLMGAAAATLLSFAAGAGMSLILSNRFYSVPYPLRRMAPHIFYFLFLLVCYVLFVRNDVTISDYCLKVSLLLGGFALLCLTDAKNILRFVRLFKEKTLA